MFKNYFKIAIRNVIRNKTFSLINILGLSLGMAFFIMTMMFVSDELSYDSFFKDGDKLFRVIRVHMEPDGETSHNIFTPPLLSYSLKKDFKEVSYASYITPYPATFARYKDKCFMESGIMLVGIKEPNFFKIFTYAFIRGNPDTAFRNGSDIVITEETAEKYFGLEDPMGKFLTIGNGRNSENLRITGVIRVPKNSHLKFSVLAVAELPESYWSNLSNWKQMYCVSYIRLRNDVDVELFKRKIYDYFNRKLMGKEGPEWLHSAKITLQPVKNIHLYSRYLREPNALRGDINLIYALYIIAFSLLIVACINYLNLATARYSMRQMEIRIRKVLGTARRQIVSQFLGESVVLSLISLLLVLPIVELLLPIFNSFMGKEFFLSDLISLEMAVKLLGLSIMTGIMAGSYPAYFFSNFKLAELLKRASNKGKLGRPLRRFLVIGQFTFSIILLISIFTIFRQVDYIEKKKLGYDIDNIICLEKIPMEFIKGKLELFKRHLKTNSAILNISAPCLIPGSVSPETTSVLLQDWEGRNGHDDVSLAVNVVDPEFAGTFGIQLILGKPFSSGFNADNDGIILNESAVKELNMKNPVGKWVIIKNQKFKVLGVVKDILFPTLRDKYLLPHCALICKQIFGNYPVNVSIRIKPGYNLHEISQFIEKQWKAIYPEFPIKSHPFSDYFAKFYQEERDFGFVVTIFAAMAIFVSCIGLFGLVSFMAELRTKEIGVRKALGSSIIGIIGLLVKESLVLVVISNVIAWPMGYWIMKSWLGLYTYHVTLNLWTFLASGSLVIAFVLSVVGYKAYKAATANPVKCLRYE